MTEVKIKYDNKKYRIKITGHSLVCTAVSTLTYTLAQSLICAQDDRKIRDLRYDLFSGKAFIEVSPEKSYRSEIETMIQTIIIGFELLENRYPEEIKITEKHIG